MKKLKNILFLSSLLFTSLSINPSFAKTENIQNLVVKDQQGKKVNLSDYKGKVLMIVNVASHCGHTPQYEGLETLYKTYKSKGFEVLGFPSNDFGNQEPGTNEEIKMFCKKNYGVTFKLFDKVKVLGNEKSPLYAKLVKSTSNKDIDWNFEKFIISRNGEIVKRFPSGIKPLNSDVVETIKSEIAKKL